LEQRLSASEARADAAERKLETYFLEKASLEREIADLRERLSRVPSQEAQDEAFRLRVERAAEARIATERLASEEMQTKAELAGLFAQIREMTLRSAGVTSTPPPTATSAADELARVKRAAEAEIESRKREFASLQADIGRENATLRRELASVRAKLNAKLAVGTTTDADSESSPWAAEFSFASPERAADVAESSRLRKLSRPSPSDSTESFIEITPSATDANARFAISG
jgi:regulator of replication initiation timing